MQQSLDRFSVPMSSEKPRFQILTDELQVTTCDMCGGPAHYRIRGIKGTFCLPCGRDEAKELGLDAGEVELIP